MCGEGTSVSLQCGVTGLWLLCEGLKDEMFEGREVWGKKDHWVTVWRMRNWNKKGLKEEKPLTVWRKKD